MLTACNLLRFEAERKLTSCRRLHPMSANFMRNSSDHENVKDEKSFLNIIAMSGYKIYEAPICLLTILNAVEFNTNRTVIETKTAFNTTKGARLLKKHKFKP